MAVSERLSSERVPRSVWRAAETSAMTSSRLEAVERTAPVQVASPMVRNLTISLVTVSWSWGLRKSVTARRVPLRSKISRSWAK